MRNILSDSSYRKLTEPQRVAAAIAAEGRADLAEVETLKSTSDAGVYRINCIQVRLNEVRAMAIAINLDLMSCFAEWLLAQGSGFDDPDTIEKAERVTNHSLMKAASIVVARDQWIEDLGIDPGDYDNFDGSRNPMLDGFLKRAEGMDDPIYTDAAIEVICGFFKDRYPK